MNNFLREIRLAARSLAARPGFSLVVIATLALGIGAATTIFSILDAVLLKALPYPQQDRLVEVSEIDQSGHAMRFAQPNFDDLVARNRSLDAVAAYGLSPEAIVGGSEPVRTNAALVSPNFFRVLGLKPQLGRFISPDAQDGESVVVSYGFWQRILNGRTDLENAKLRFENHSFNVIGVMPPRTEFPPGVEVWYPASIFPPYISRNAHNFRVIARLREGVSLAQASAEVETIGRAVKAEHTIETDATTFGLTPMRERFVRDFRSTLLVLCGAVGLLLAIACSNVANLLLARMDARRREIAVRSALGASRFQLAKQFLVETSLLALVAGALGSLLASWGVEMIMRLYHGEMLHVGEIGVNTTVLFFALGVSLALALVLGLLPLLSASHREFTGDLRDAARGSSVTRTRARNVFIIAQVALTLILLVGAGLLGRSFERLLAVDPGFHAESVVAMTVTLPPPANDHGAQRSLAEFYRTLFERLGALPGVNAVGGVNVLPMNGEGANGTFLVQGGGPTLHSMDELIHQFQNLSPDERTRDADYRVASAKYFAAMEIPLLRGRLFHESDGPNSPHVAVISQSMARRYWPNGDSLGQQIQFGNMDGDLHVLTIVGIVGDVRSGGLDREPRPTVYTNYYQRPAGASDFSIVVRAGTDPSGLISAMRRVTRDLNPEVPMKFETIRQIVAASFDRRRFSMVVLGLFAGAALLLAMVGLYGVMSYITSQRTNEIGIRMALGAQRGRMLRMILRQSFTLVGFGMVVGVALSLGVTQIMRSFLFGIGAIDLVTYCSVIALLVFAAFVASFFPARRAMKVDPMIALRYE